MELGRSEFAVVERVRTAIERRGLLGRGDRVVAAISGGPDSMCLLDVLPRTRLDLEVLVAHVDHGLGDRSEEVGATVSALAAKGGFEVHLMRARDLQGPNLQARARDVRREFLAIVAQRVGARAIATGHTMDDRVETTIARLIHGAGTAGLAGVRPSSLVDGASYVRPLLDVSRAETRSYCEAVGLWFFDDPANDDVRFERVAVRRTVIAPILERWGKGALRAMARSAERLAEDAAALDGQAERLATTDPGDEAQTARLELALLRAMPRALRRRVLESAIGRGDRDRQSGIDEILDALDRPHLDPGLGFDVSGGTRVTIESEHLVVARGEPSDPADRMRR